MSQAGKQTVTMNRSASPNGMAPRPDAPAMLGALIAGRSSCRQFASEPLPHACLADIFAMAQFAPSWCNAQPWQVVLVSGKEAKNFGKDLYAHAAGQRADETPDYAFPASYQGIYQDRRRHTARQLYESLGIAWGDRLASGNQSLENFRFFGAPHVAIVTSDAALGSYGAVDCGVYAAYVALAAQSMGAATIIQAALARYPDFIRARFDLPETRHIVFGIALGYADSAHPANGFRTPRAPLDQVVRWVD